MIGIQIVEVREHESSKGLFDLSFFIKIHMMMRLSRRWNLLL